MNKESNRILVGAPTSIRHSHCIEKHWESVKDLPCDFIYIDTTPEEEGHNHYQRLKELVGDKGKVFRSPFDLDEKSVHQWLADARNYIREYFLEHEEYTHLWYIDTDIILPCGGKNLEVLLDADKDQIGFPYSLYAKSETEYHPPNVMKHGWIIMDNTSTNEGRKTYDFYSWKELEELECPAKVYSTGMGCLLIKRKVLENVPFRTHPTFIVGEDIWFHTEANEKGYEAWCYHKIRPEHMNVSWKCVDPGVDMTDIMLVPKGVVSTPKDLPEVML